MTKIPTFPKMPHNQLWGQKTAIRRGVFLTLFINMFLAVLRGKF